jgi:hypothetical protein
MRTRLAVVVLLLLATPSWAVKMWYDHYDEALQLMRAKKYTEALKALDAARKERSESGTRIRTYGLEFADYFPLYQEGICYQALGEVDSAILRFNIEEKNGAIRENAAAYGDLVRRRNQAQAQADQGRARQVRQNVDLLHEQAQELFKAKRYDDALAKLVDALKLASNLDEQTQHNLQKTQADIRAEQKKAEAATDHARRFDQAVADGKKMLDDGRDTEASRRFQDALDLDPQNAEALKGKSAAEASIRAKNTLEALGRKYEEGRALVDAGKYDEAVLPLTEAATHPRLAGARELLERTRAILDRIGRTKDRNQRVTQLIAEGNRLFDEAKYADAQVRFDAALALDPENLRARDRQVTAERYVSEAIYDKIFPSRPPDLLVTDPAPNQLEVEGPIVAFHGFASDDRAIARIEFSVGGLLVKTIELPQDLDRPESTRNVPFHESLELPVMGTNEVVVRAFDRQGKVSPLSFQITRKRQVHEQPWFFPAAAGTAFTLVALGFGTQRLRRRQAMRRRFNPYIAGAPILSDDMFFGRRKLLTRILNVLHHNSLMITGERRIGKTTLLYQLKKALETDDATEYRFFPVFIDLQGVDERGFFPGVMADVVDALQPSAETMTSLRFRHGHPNIGTPVPQPPVASEAEFTSAERGGSGGPTQGPPAQYDGRDFSHDLQRIVDELKHRTTKKVKLALLIDEVDVLNSFSERINQRLRSIFMKTFSEHLVAIMSGVGVKRIWTSEGSPWYNFFDEIELTPFAREEAEALIREPVEDVFRWEPDAVEAVLRWSGGKPYLVQKICIHSVNRMLEEGRTTVILPDVEAAHELARTFAEEDAPVESVTA